MLRRNRSVASTEQCRHPHPLPRWDRMEDVGKQDRIVRWYCPACATFLSVGALDPGRGLPAAA
jgi:hypothetical protein